MSVPEVHRLTVGRTARVLTVGGPTGPNDRFGECWIVCHGYRQLADRFLRRFERIAGPDRRVVAPEALSRFYVDPTPGRHGPESRVGGTWMTRHSREDEISDYVAYLDRVRERFAAGADAVTILGFSQGGHTAVRWAVLGEIPPERLIIWGAYVPGDLDLERWADRLSRIEIVQVHGNEDPTRSELLQGEQDGRLEQAGLRLHSRVHPGGHRIDPELLDRLAGR